MKIFVQKTLSAEYTIFIFLDEVAQFFSFLWFLFLKIWCLIYNPIICFQPLHPIFRYQIVHIH